MDDRAKQFGYSNASKFAFIFKNVPYFLVYKKKCIMSSDT